MRVCLLPTPPYMQHLSLLQCLMAEGMFLAVPPFALQEKGQGSEGSREEPGYCQLSLPEHVLPGPPTETGISSSPLCFPASTVIVTSKLRIVFVFKGKGRHM